MLYLTCCFCGRIFACDLCYLYLSGSQISTYMLCLTEILSMVACVPCRSMPCQHTLMMIMATEQGVKEEGKEEENGQEEEGEEGKEEEEEQKKGQEAEREDGREEEEEVSVPV